MGNAFAPGQDGWLLTVNASNVGRLPVTVLEQGVAFKVGGKWKHAPLGMMPPGTVEPSAGTHRLPDSESVTWVMTPGPIAASVADEGARKVYAYVRLATGKTLRSRKAVDVVRLARMR
jgi:hypothetical protein